MSFKELFRLYGLAALFSSTRKLHQDNLELKTRDAIREQQAAERVAQVEQRADSERQRLLLKNGVPSENLTGAAPLVMPKRKASKFAQRIQKAKERENAYHQLANTSPTLPLDEVIEQERQFDPNSLLKAAAAITNSSLN
jgi:uncharacterized caspase-like protein